MAETRVVTPEQHAEVLRSAFNQICDETDWKNPVDAIVPWDSANVYLRAIQFMTGSIPTYEILENSSPLKCRIIADGYYIATGEGR